eukprot:9139895-Ditylum_brightwellii.AAC.1
MQTNLIYLFKKQHKLKLKEADQITQIADELFVFLKGDTVNKVIRRKEQNLRKLESLCHE